MKQFLFLTVGLVVSTTCLADEQVEFFERRVRPILVEHCYSCHSAESYELQANLRLDTKTGWELGGESGGPAIVPGSPDDSLLIRSIRHDPDVSAMPPSQTKLPPQAIEDLTTWVAQGAVDPRRGEVPEMNLGTAWETAFQRRMEHWSLKPLQPTDPPQIEQDAWVRTEVDRYILAALQHANLEPVEQADRQTLVRRLSFALTGLPPSPQLLGRYAANASPTAYDDLVDELLSSPHFGQRWARHWMDVVHYADTHGYEWDVPAKNAWRYRDYLVRAFNLDLPYDRFVLEQIAGDLLEPRIDPDSGINEALIGPMMLRLGERRHGDNAAAEGVAQEAVANMIDTLGKAFLATTLACAQCHDHKLDAVQQQDYYSLAGMLMSTRFGARSIEATDPNLTVLEDLRNIKDDLRGEVAKLWLQATDPEQLSSAVVTLRAISANAQANAAFPESLADFWLRSLTTPVSAEEFSQQREQRLKANRQHLTLLADFTVDQQNGGSPVAGWRWEGWGMHHGLVRNGELIVSDEGNQVLQHLLPAGRFSHVYSQRLAGSVQSTQLDPSQPVTFSIEMAAGKCASSSFIVDRALNPERMQFPSNPHPSWRTFTAGNFDSLEGTVDTAPRQVYFELATKSLNNYFPPRVGYGGVKETELADERSWFGVTRVYQHPVGHPPLDELQRFTPLFDELAEQKDWSQRLIALLRGAVERWVDDECSAEDVRLLNEALQLQLLPNDRSANAEIDQLVNRYRYAEKQLQPDRTVGSVAEWFEGQDAKVGIRGSYTDLGDAVQRGRVRFLAELLTDSMPNKPMVTSEPEPSSQRLPWAKQIVDPRNPLTARVYVNRIWHYLFGEGLVRTPDDFGHLGERPTHPELLDYLATRFMNEGWSTKNLIRLLVRSAVWRQKSVPNSESVQIDPENRWWHHHPMRRLEAEAIRDAMLAVTECLDSRFEGPSIEPFRAAEDVQKRLFVGPLDGDRRRSLYIEMTLMEPPRLLALFNQPIPKMTVGHRDVTNVPDQALALLNDPFVIGQARLWSQHLIEDDSTSTAERIERMLVAALGRSARIDEVDRLQRLAGRSAELRGLSDELLRKPEVWQDVAHAVFNLKEFLYIP